MMRGKQVSCLWADNSSVDTVGECATEILQKVLLITEVKIFRHCIINNFTKDYFRQQYQRTPYPNPDRTRNPSQ